VMLQMEDAGKLHPEISGCIEFLALVGCRLSEAIGLDLADVNFKTGAWRLPDAKAGKRVVMLGAPALALLTALGRTSGPAFQRPDGRPVSASSIEKAWSGVKANARHRTKARPGIRDLAGVPDLRIHDLRHGVGTYAGSSGMNAFLVRDLLGQKTMAMAGRYVSKHADPLRAAADVVSNQIAAALAGETAEVIPLRKR
jgi:integrase